jgi:hypothetical protein
MNVEINEWVYDTAPEILETIGLGPCMGIAIYDQRTQSGYLAHLVSPKATKHWNEFMAEVSNRFSDLSKLEVTLAGACIEDEDDVGNREYVLEDLERRGFKKINTEFNDDLCYCADLVLYLNNGELEIEHTDLNDFRDLDLY